MESQDRGDVMKGIEPDAAVPDEMPDKDQEGPPSDTDHVVEQSEPQDRESGR